MSRFNEAFLFLAAGADPTERTARESELVRTLHVPVPDADRAAEVARELIADGLDLIELYGGFGPSKAAPVIETAGGTVPVGLVGVDEDTAVRHRGVIFMGLGADPAQDRYVHGYPRAR